MARLKKALLRVGKYQSPDGTIDVTPERLKHWQSTFRRMSKENIGIPMGWDHSDDPAQTVPVAFSSTKDKKRSAANAVGWLDDFKLTPDGKAAELTFDIADEKAADKAEKNVVEVSPIIYPNWTDGKGRAWSDCITHVDLVNHPVDAGQTPFTKADQPAIACSIRMGLDVGKPQLYRMADDEDGKAGDDKGDGASTQAQTTTDADENPDMPKNGEAGEDEKRLESILAHLALLTEPVVLPSDTDGSNFLERLQVALMTAKAAKDAAAAKKAEEDESNKEDDDDMSKATESQPQFAAMSLYTERLHRRELTNRLDALLRSGRCTPAEAKAQTEALAAVKLSLNAQGEPEKSASELWLESRESLPSGAAWKSEDRLRMATEVKPPEFAVEEMDDAKAQDIADQVLHRNKRKTAAAV